MKKHVKKFEVFEAKSANQLKLLMNQWLENMEIYNDFVMHDRLQSVVIANERTLFVVSIHYSYRIDV